MKDLIQRSICSIGQLKDIRPVAAMLSIVTLFIAVNTQNPLNNDGILYLQTADAFTTSGWQAAMKLYCWPFYSVMIAWLGKLAHLSFEYTAHVLNAGLLVVIVTTFITLTKELGASRTVQFFGAIIILSHPRLNHYQDYIIRGFGYWAFSLLSLLSLIRYYRHLRWRHALGWGICISFATLFRIEGAVLCCLTPLVLLLRSNKGLWSRLGHTLKPYTVNIITLSILLIWWLSMADRSGAQLGRLNEFWIQLQDGLLIFRDTLHEKAALISETVLGDASKKWGLTMTVSGLAGICLYRLVTTIGPLHTLLSAHAVCKNLMPIEDGSKKVLNYFILLNLLIPIVHIGQTFIVSHRFFMLASLLLLLWAPFSLDRIFQHWRGKKKGLTGHFLLFPLLSFVFLVMLIHAFVPPKQSGVHVVLAGKWLKDNMPLQARLYSNTRQIPFYAQRQLISWDVSGDFPKPEWTSDDFVALKVHRTDYEDFTKSLSKSELRLIKVFSNEKGNRVMIFGVTKGENGLTKKHQ